LSNKVLATGNFLSGKREAGRYMVRFERDRVEIQRDINIER
jgi:hypothetical protein